MDVESIAQLLHLYKILAVLGSHPGLVYHATLSSQIAMKHDTSLIHIIGLVEEVDMQPTSLNHARVGRDMKYSLLSCRGFT